MNRFVVLLLCCVSLSLFSGEGGPESGPGFRGRTLEIPENDQNERGRSRSRTPRLKDIGTSARTRQHEVNHKTLERISTTIKEKKKKIENSEENEINVED